MNKRSCRNREIENGHKEVNMDIAQENSSELKDLGIQIERIHQLPRTMDENRPHYDI